MKKQELIHLHGLLAEMRAHLEMNGIPLNTSSYEELGVKPTSIHKSKNDQKEAVFELAESVAVEDPEIRRDYLSSEDIIFDDTQTVEADSEDTLESTRENLEEIRMPEDISLEQELEELYEEIFRYGLEKGELTPEQKDIEIRVDEELLDSIESHETWRYWEKIQDMRKLEEHGYIETEGEYPVNHGRLLKVNTENVSEVVKGYMTPRASI